mgnify:CR=1 FL=1
MANIKSQQKRILTNERRRLRNKSVKSALHTAVRAFREAAAEGDKDKAGVLLVATSRKLDKADNALYVAESMKIKPSRP